MMPRVRALGYVVAEATDLDLWQAFATDVLGLQVAERTGDRLRLRLDAYTYRLELRRSDKNAITAIGWDVGGPAELDALGAELIVAGYDLMPGNTATAAEREVGGLSRFDDPDNQYSVELYWGKKTALAPFVSPTGARFVAGDLGVGHIAQVVNDASIYDRLYYALLGFRLSDHILAPAGGRDLEFLHCNARHHSFAFIEASPGSGRSAGVAHLMLEVADLDTVGRAYDRVLGGDLPLRASFGKHTNDKMLSWYVSSPSGLGIEYGTGGLLIDDETWLPTRYDDAHYWGHRRPSTVHTASPQQ